MTTHHSGPRPPDLRLETERLTLRGFELGDLDALAELLGDAEALALWGDPLDRDGARSWIEGSQQMYESVSMGRCAIVWRETGELIGDCGLVPTTVEGKPEIELGWIVRRHIWGRGVATEAGAAWRDHAFVVLGLTRIISMVSEQNVASR